MSKYYTVTLEIEVDPEVDGNPGKWDWADLLEVPYACVTDSRSVCYLRTQPLPTDEESG